MFKNKNRRIDYCDYLRTLAVISVILIHVVSNFRDMYVTQNLFYYFFFTLFRTLASFAVPMFFMFTGIFLLNNKKDNNYFEFVKKIIKKLILPLLIISIIYYLYDCLVSISISFSLKNFIINLYSNSIKYHLWYMYSIILIYFLIPFIKIGIQRMKQNE